MSRKRHKPEEIVAKLRQVDVLLAQGQTVADAIRSIGVTEVTYYRWRNEYGGLKCDQIKRLKDLGICCKVRGRLRKRRGKAQIRPRSRTGWQQRWPEPACHPHQCSEPVPF